MKHLLLSFLFLCTAVSASAQLTDTGKTVGDVSMRNIIPATFCCNPQDGGYLATYDEEGNVQVVNARLETVKSFKARKSTTTGGYDDEPVVSLMVLDFSGSYDEGSVYFTQSLFNADEKFEYITADDNGFSVIQDDGTVLQRVDMELSYDAEFALLCFADEAHTTYLNVYEDDKSSALFSITPSSPTPVKRVEVTPALSKALHSLSGQRLSAHPRSGVYVDGGRKHVAR